MEAYKIEISRKATDKILSDCEKILLREYKQSLDTIKKQIITVYEKYSSDGVLTYAEMSKYNRLNRLFKSVNEEVVRLSGKSEKIVNHLAYDAFGESFYLMGYEIEVGCANIVNAPVDLGFGLLNKDTIIAAVENPMNKIAYMGLRDSMLIKARSTITQGLIQGQSYFKMAQGLKKDFEGKAKNNLRIARTEAGRAQCKGNLASIEHAQAEGAELEKFWISTLDKDTRPTHRDMDGQIADKDGMFTLAGIQIDRPMADALPPEELINCRCDIGVNVKDFKPTHRRAGGKIVKYKNYKEWKEAR